MTFRMDRRAIAVLDADCHAAGAHDAVYWLSRPAAERIAAVEFLRRQAHGAAPDFNEFFTLLNARRVEYVVVGDYALALHGAPATPAIWTFWSTPHMTMPLGC